MNNPVTFEEFCSYLKIKIFGYQNIKEEVKQKLYIDIESANKIAIEEVNNFLSEKLGLPDDVIEEVGNRLDEEEKKQAMIEAIYLLIEDVFENKTIKKDGYCLKEKLLHKAVQMRHNKDMLGFITKLDDDIRFVYVDFGDKEEEVKIDVDELIIAG